MRIYVRDKAGRFATTGGSGASAYAFDPKKLAGSVAKGSSSGADSALKGVDDFTSVFEIAGKPPKITIKENIDSDYAAGNMNAEVPVAAGFYSHYSFGAGHSRRTDPQVFVGSKYGDYARDTMVHELWHAMDYNMGPKGRPWSESSKEWNARVEKTKVHKEVWSKSQYYSNPTETFARFTQQYVGKKTGAPHKKFFSDDEMAQLSAVFEKAAAKKGVKIKV